MRAGRRYFCIGGAKRIDRMNTNRNQTRLRAPIVPITNAERDLHEPMPTNSMHETLQRSSSASTLALFVPLESEASAS